MKKNFILILMLVFGLTACNNEKAKENVKPESKQENVEKKSQVNYPEVTDKYVALQGDENAWDDKVVHTFSIIEYPNHNDYKYWGYYGLDNYNEKDSKKKKAGLVFSNDLKHWKKYKGNPIINDNCRWPTATVSDGKVYIFYAQYNQDGDSQIVMQTADDGIHFKDMKTVVPYQAGMQNQNPFIYFNPNDKLYYLFYYSGTERSKTDKYWNIMLKKAKNLTDLPSAKPVLVIHSKATMAAPSVVFYKGKYYLLVEEFNNSAEMDRWVTNAFYSDKIDSGYQRVANNPVLSDNDACAFQYLLDNKLYVTFSHALDKAKSKWNLKMIQVK